ncbi:hypothetical protein NDU88_000075 [Pleurodeles waltl]|uniref:Uncharacterized protein n=1 Tax=Pleurodeles waltl TaxID=8319 RepID=A0AAV7S8L3_PLEWA|nr:hypothetical protein NDU88_000075 [Pleurodeles waltl]
MGTLPTGAHQAGALSAPSARQFNSPGGQLLIPSPLRDRGVAAVCHKSMWEGRCPGTSRQCPARVCPPLIRYRGGRCPLWPRPQPPLGRSRCTPPEGRQGPAVAPFLDLGHEQGPSACR